MGKKHEVNIMVSNPDGSRMSVVKTRKCRLREGLRKRIFGEAGEIFILNSGETVETVAIRVIKGA